MFVNLVLIELPKSQLSKSEPVKSTFAIANLLEPLIIFCLVNMSAVLVDISAEFKAICAVLAITSDFKALVNAVVCSDASAENIIFVIAVLLAMVVVVFPEL
jgi:hypothetical protein